MINDYAKKRAREYMQRTRDYDGPFKKKYMKKQRYLYMKLHVNYQEQFKCKFN